MPITESDNLVAFHLLVSAETDVVAAFLRRGRRTVAVDDGGVEKIGLMQLQHRAGKDGPVTEMSRFSLISSSARSGSSIARRARSQPALSPLLLSARARARF